MSGLNVERHGGGWSEYESRFRSARRFRLLIMAGGLIVGAVLIVNGQTLIGVLVAGFAISRLVAVSWLGRGRRFARSRRVAAGPPVAPWPCPRRVRRGRSRDGYPG